MIVLVEGVICLLNAFPSSNGESYTMSLSTIVIGKHNPDANQKIITFVSYAMLYISTNNNMHIRSVP